MTKRTILIDGDLLCYQVALSAEHATNWADAGDPELWTVHADAEETRSRFKAAIYGLKTDLGADWAEIAITKDTENFRKKVLPTYKGNRSANRKPILLAHLRQFCIDHFGALWDARLEADDILGILATGGAISEWRATGTAQLLGEVIIVSADKDLKTIPGLHYNPEHPERGVVNVVPYQADRFFMAQALGGDITDNYTGCPGIGYERAEEWLAKGVRWESYEHVFKTGKRKGLSETRWREFGPTAAMTDWEAVVSAYKKAGLTEQDALVQARCARILRAEDYVDGEVKLWSPS